MRDRAARLSGEIPIVPRPARSAGKGPETAAAEAAGARTTAVAAPGPDAVRTTRTRARAGSVESTTVAAPARQEPPAGSAAGSAAGWDTAREGRRPAGKSTGKKPAGKNLFPRSPGRDGTDPARSSLAAALGLTAASTALPGSGHLAMRRRRTGGLILGVLLTVVAVLVVLVLAVRRSTLLQNLLSTSALTGLAIALIVGGIGWIAVVARTYALARPRNLTLSKKIIGTGTAALLCLTVAVPFGYGVELLNSQRSLLNSLFKGGGTDAATALGKPRLNVLLLGSDAGPDRAGTRTDSMMLSSIDTTTGRTTLFSLPRNIQRAQFPPGSPMAEKFPDGFHDPSQPLSGDYLLNAVYAYGERDPSVAPSGPTPFPGVNLLQSSISYMTGLPIDYYLEVNMAGFSSMIDAVGGVTVNVGSEPVPIGGVTAGGTYVKPDGYIQPGIQNLSGTEALWFARSRRNGTDYQRMGRQRCLIQAVINEKSPAELLTRFQAIAAATKDTVYTDMPQQVLPALAVLADDGFRLESIAFDPTLPDPNASSGQFDTANPDVSYMQEVAQKAIADPPPPPGAAAPAAPAPSTSASPSSSESSSEEPSTSASPTPAPSAAPVSVQDACAGVSAAPAPGTAGDESDSESGSGSGTGTVGGITGLPSATLNRSTGG
ncbi:LCP family protein [Pseudonocardia sp. KRD-291]|nr:LCP family protein [Pseudonocardia sp. KRD291]